MARKAKKPVPKKWTEKADKAYDRKNGIKENSARDKRLDKKRGVKD